MRVPPPPPPYLPTNSPSSHRCLLIQSRASRLRLLDTGFDAHTAGMPCFYSNSRYRRDTSRLQPARPPSIPSLPARHRLRYLLSVVWPCVRDPCASTHCSATSATFNPFPLGPVCRGSGFDSRRWLRYRPSSPALRPYQPEWEGMEGGCAPAQKHHSVLQPFLPGLGWSSPSTKAMRHSCVEYRGVAKHCRPPPPPIHPILGLALDEGAMESDSMDLCDSSRIRARHAFLLC